MTRLAGVNVTFHVALERIVVDSADLFVNLNETVGIAALTVLRNSQVLQATSHIVGLVALCTGTNTSYSTTWIRS